MYQTPPVVLLLTRGIRLGIILHTAHKASVKCLVSRETPCYLYDQFGLVPTAQDEIGWLAMGSDIWTQCQFTPWCIILPARLVPRPNL